MMMFGSKPTANDERVTVMSLTLETSPGSDWTCPPGWELWGRRSEVTEGRRWRYHTPMRKKHTTLSR